MRCRRIGHIALVLPRVPRQHHKASARCSPASRLISDLLHEAKLRRCDAPACSRTLTTCVPRSLLCGVAVRGRASLPQTRPLTFSGRPVDVKNRGPATPSRIAWAQLLARVFDIDGLTCPRLECDGRLKATGAASFHRWRRAVPWLSRASCSHRSGAASTGTRSQRRSSVRSCFNGARRVTCKFRRPWRAGVATAWPDTRSHPQRISFPRRGQPATRSGRVRNRNSAPGALARAMSPHAQVLAL